MITLKLSELKKHIGMSLNEIKLVPYNPIWAEIYEQNKLRLQKILSKFDDTFDIHHIGGTSIPNIRVTKPIIDILVRTTKEWAEFDKSGLIPPPIESPIMDEIKIAGLYEENKTISWFQGDCLFVVDPGEDSFIYNSIHVEKNVHNDSFLLFKRYILEHPETADEYCSLKEACAAQANVEFIDQEGRRLQAYTYFKRKFVDMILSKAAHLYGV